MQREIFTLFSGPPRKEPAPRLRPLRDMYNGSYTYRFRTLYGVEPISGLPRFAHNSGVWSKDK